MRRPIVQDTALAITLLLLCVVLNGHDETASETGVLWWSAALLATAGVALRRRWPETMLAVCCLAAAIHLAESMPLTIVNLSVPILLYTVATRRGWAVSLAVLAGLLVLAIGSSSFAVLKHVPPPAIRMPVREIPEPPRPGPIADELTGDGRIIAWNDLPGLILILVAAWAVGAGMRSRRAYLAELRARAVDRERERGQQAVLAIAAERGRISRELHDVVAHGLSVMVIQAQGGAAALDNRPADTRAALEAIIKTGRDSLADMRRVLATVGEVDDAWHPQPGLAMLPALVDQVREAGTPVHLTIDDPPPELPSAVDLSAYRIVQEALTNTIKHGGTGTRAHVGVTRSATAVHITVSDDGAGTTPGDGQGAGLRGMRERVRLLGGRFDAGPSPAGGFVVHAELPVEE
ncbi:two-component sensor histidine kinase [Actinoplanes sp. OR16]|uniref:sensor histidine kinase n=1 Tax=Actinoplanes sp. OR16 TaxID=946334 RepID=UPI000F70CD5B|nr:sensor histidine kinase [Actinoplanes sp. OR16]BBH67955.1 two-component sensor histidine kinase [Actinoplanes sp. OR16]